MSAQGCVLLEQETPSLALNQFNANDTRLPAAGMGGGGLVEMMLVIVEGREWEEG